MGDFHKHLTVRNKMLQRILLAAVCSILLVINSCKDKITDPEDKPGSRNYTWTVDTIDGTVLSLHGVWGSSPDNIWVYGPSGDDNKKMWLYDGIKLRPVGPPEISPNCISGFSKNNLLAGSGSDIWRYNGSRWLKEFKAEPETLENNLKYFSFYDILGKQTNNIWAVGATEDLNKSTFGFICNFNGTKWQKKYVSKQNNYFFLKIYQTDREDKYFIFGSKRNFETNVNYSLILEYNASNNSINEIFSSPFTTSQACWIDNINGKLFFTMNKKIYKYEKEQFVEYINVSTINNGAIINGRNEKDLFIWLEEGLGHYNGTDVKYIFRQDNPVWVLGDMAVFEKEIFFIARDNKTGNYYFVKGVLNN